MKIRSLTYFDSPGQEIGEGFLERSRSFAAEARSAFSAAGFEVQTTRFASPPFPLFLGSLAASKQIEFAIALEDSLISQGYDYISLGPALPDCPDSFDLIPDLIHATRATFCSGALTIPGGGVSLPAVKACGKIIQALAPLDPNGFANLYFAALGNVPPGAPFFPAAYHGGGRPAFSVAIEGADLAGEAFSGAESWEDARQALVRSLEEIGAQISAHSRDLGRSCGAAYQGIDFSLAPHPDPGFSIGGALEELGLPALGQHGSLAAAAFLADSIDRAEFQRVGFSGLMLPVLEDAVLAARAAEGKLTLKDLLLYAAVCGTGLDTVPLPGGSTAEQISPVLLDLAALSLRLAKPLTARLMPIPGKDAGDPTNFDFPFFANSRVMSLDSAELGGLFGSGEILDITHRQARREL